MQMKVAPPTLISEISSLWVCHTKHTLNSVTWQVKFVELRKSVPNTVTFLHGRLRISLKPSPCNLAVGKLIELFNKVIQGGEDGWSTITWLAVL